MQLLVSDYDGTLNPPGGPFRIHNLQLNIDAIHRFREEGNKFMISTGRTLPGIRQEIEKHQIPFVLRQPPHIPDRYRRAWTLP